jgi:hypothetical protein
VLVDRGTTVILSGTAQLEEFSVLAAAVAKSLDSSAADTSPGSSPGATVSPSAVPSP